VALSVQTGNIAEINGGRWTESYN